MYGNVGCLPAVVAGGMVRYLIRSADSAVMTQPSWPRAVPTQPGFPVTTVSAFVLSATPARPPPTPVIVPFSVR